MTPSELLTAPATAPEASRVRDTLRELAERGKDRGASLHAASNETWRDRKTAVMDKIRAARDRALFARQELFNMIGTVKVLGEQPELRRELYGHLETAVERAADTAVDKGIAAVDRAEARMKELYAITAETVGLAKAQAIREARVGTHLVLAKGSEILASGVDRKIRRRERWASRIHRTADFVDKAPEVAARGREGLVSVGRKMGESLTAGGLVLREAIQEALRFRNPIRSLARHFDAPRQEALDRKAALLQYSEDRRTVAAEIRAASRSGTNTEANSSTQVDQNGAGATPDAPPFGSTRPWEAPEYQIDTPAGIGSAPSMETPTRTSPFDAGSAGATPAERPGVTPIDNRFVSAGDAASMAADKRFDTYSNNSK